jgi:hypothetical protein
MKVVNGLTSRVPYMEGGSEGEVEVENPKGLREGSVEGADGLVEAGLLDGSEVGMDGLVVAGLLDGAAVGLDGLLVEGRLEGGEERSYYINMIVKYDSY